MVNTALTRQFTWPSFFTCYVISLGQIAFGYPAAIIGSVLAMSSFLKYMKLTDSAGLVSAEGNQLIGAINGVFQAGAVLGVILNCWVMEKWGRRASLVYCSVLGLFGGALICGARNIAMFIVGRFFAGAGSWSFLAVTPIYTSEMSPPALRGLFSGMNGIHIALGYALASYMGLAFYFAKDPATQWRGCLGIGLLCPAVMLVITYFIPESPRWLLMKGRVEEARSTVLILHSSKADPEQEFACQEFSQMKTQADLDKTLNPSWSEMVRRASYRKRVLIAAGFAIIGQSTAVLVINNYGQTLYKSLGFDTKDQLALQCGWLTVSIFGNFFGAVVLDYFGRRRSCSPAWLDALLR
ncbi:general substrate transporter [Mycena galopus ATCC 62051]|nr:general substrate transporter [Mycena galopus ATCC 62051]